MYIKRNRKQEHKSSYYHLDKVFFVSFFLGILLANVIQDSSKNRFFMLNEYYMQQFKYTKIDYNQLLLFILENRIPMLLLLILLSFTVIGIVSQILFVGYFGASFGFLCVMAITNFGWKGFIYMGGFLFPHYLFYLPFYLLFLKLFVAKKEGITLEKSVLIKQIGIMTVLFCTGIIVESYVNPPILIKLLKIF